MEKIETHEFGTTGHEVTIVGLGGEGILRTYGNAKEASAVILEAIDQGIRYFDSARVYAGSEEYYGSVWPSRPEIRTRIFQASKSASRTKKGALAELGVTLKNMGLDYLDLWQIHDVRTEHDLEEIAGPGGALEAFVTAKKEGRVRYIGVTGHHDPDILTRAVRQWPVDAVMLPINPVEGALGGFLTTTMAEARKREMAVIGMKVLGAGHYILPELKITPEMLIGFALSQKPTVIIAGCSTSQEVQTLANAGRTFKPLSDPDQQKIVDQFRPHAAYLAYYRGTLASQGY